MAADAKVTIPPTKTFANLPSGTPNGAYLYCFELYHSESMRGRSDGALAKRLNGAWVCN
jgi:hypothetical protein